MSLRLMGALALLSAVPNFAMQPAAGTRHFFTDLLEHYQHYKKFDLATKSKATRADLSKWVAYAQAGHFDEFAKELSVSTNWIQTVVDNLRCELEYLEMAAIPGSVQKSTCPSLPAIPSSQLVPQAAVQKAAPSVAPSAPLQLNPVIQPKGFKNLGANCFMNAALQGIMSLEDLNKILFNQGAGFFEKGTVAYNYVELLKEVAGQSETIIDPQLFCVSARTFMGVGAGTQEDTNEFITFFLDSLVSKTADKRKNEQIKNLFEIMVYTFTDGKKTQEQAELTLVVPPTKPYLYECLNDFFAAEKVEKGGKMVSSQEKLARTSRYIVVGLKRTGFNAQTQTPYKINTPISFPLNNLDLTTYFTGDVVSAPYRLKACILHTGEVGVGHYIAYVKRGTKWYLVDDTTVVEKPLSEIETLSAKGIINDFLPTTFIYEH